MSSATLSLEALITAKGGEIHLETLTNCDKIFLGIQQPDEVLTKILGNLWLDGIESLPRDIETALSNARNSSATTKAYENLYATMIFPAQKHDPATMPLLVRRYGEPALQKTDRKSEQPLPPNISAKNYQGYPSSTSETATHKILGPSVSTSSKLKKAQHPPPGAPHSRAGKGNLKIEKQNRPKEAPKNAGSAGFAEISRGTGISGISKGQTTTVDPYTAFTVTIQYWLSEGILNQRSRERANNHVPKLFNGSPLYTPYLTVLAVKRAADMEEYRHKLIAASSTCLYQTHCLFESSEKDQTQVTQEAGSKPVSTGEQEYNERDKIHFGILMGELNFEVFQLRPKLLEGTTTWNGFKATLVAASSLRTLGEIKVLLHWVSLIHRWGATKHLAHFQTDLDKFQDSDADQSLVAEL
ncbi:hypothetical protein MMC17_000699 [Xylographa soralifera]|nr:hypothetical protein [Xylographa soralifera]